MLCFSAVLQDRPAKTNMRSAAKPWSPAIRAGGHGPDRARPLPATASGMKSSKSSTSLAFESRLSRVWTKMHGARHGAWIPWVGRIEEGSRQTSGLWGQGRRFPRRGHRRTSMPGHEGVELARGGGGPLGSRKEVCKMFNIVIKVLCPGLHGHPGSFAPSTTLDGGRGHAQSLQPTTIQLWFFKPLLLDPAAAWTLLITPFIRECVLLWFSPPSIPLVSKVGWAHDTFLDSSLF